MPETTPSPTSAPAPREVFAALLERFSAGKWSEVAELYAEDAVVEIPFALPAADRIEGRAALHARFTAMAAAGGIELHAENVRVHETADPETIVGEFDYRGRVPGTGRSFRVANIQVLRIRDGLIVATRDFHDHAALGVATGGIAGLDEALGGLDLDRVSAA